MFVQCNSCKYVPKCIIIIISIKPLFVFYGSVLLEPVPSFVPTGKQKVTGFDWWCKKIGSETIVSLQIWKLVAVQLEI